MFKRIIRTLKEDYYWRRVPVLLIAAIALSLALTEEVNGLVRIVSVVIFFLASLFI